MLQTKVWVFNPTSIGSGKYTLELYFVDPTRPQYVRLGDYIKDTSTREYELVSPTSIPFSDGNTVTVLYKTSNVLPTVDVDYNSDFYTPSQLDVRPKMRTAGEIFSRSVYDGSNYEYSIAAAWSNPSEEAKAVIGDRIVDFAGKEYELTFIDPTDRFSVNCRVKEVEEEGDAPEVGIATMYTPTENFSFFQGTEIEDPSRTTIMNRDKFLIDRLLTTGGGSANYKVEEITLTSTDIIDKEVSLQQTPIDSNTLLDVMQGPSQRFGVDFNIIGNVLTWDSLGLDNLLEVGDILRVAYFY